MRAQWSGSSFRGRPFCRAPRTDQQLLKRKGHAMKGLQGKVAIVTGGATIIGAAVVEVLRGFGARVAVFDIDAAGGDRAVASDPVATRFWKVDITDDEQVAQG